MKNFLIKPFLVFTIMFITIILYWNYQDQKDFDKTFKVVHGELTGPMAVADAHFVTYINDQMWWDFRQELKNKNARIDIDSIIKPFRHITNDDTNDTIPSITRANWNRLIDELEQKTVQKDTFIIQGRSDTIRLRIKVVGYFQAKYIFGIKGKSYDFSLPIEQLLESEGKILAFEDELRFEDFENHVIKVNELLDGLEQVKITFLKRYMNSAGNYSAILPSPDIIEEMNGSEIYKDENTFKRLEERGQYYTWWDSIFMQILFWSLVIMWVPLAFFTFLLSREGGEE